MQELHLCPIASESRVRAGAMRSTRHMCMLRIFTVKGERRSKKACLKLTIQKTQIRASGPITPWQIERGKVGSVTDFIFLDSKITVDGDCNHEIKRCWILGSKAMKNLHSIVKSRDITLPTKVCIVKAMAFPIVMYRWESWIIKKVEC